MYVKLDGQILKPNQVLSKYDGRAIDLNASNRTLTTLENLPIFYTTYNIRLFSRMTEMPENARVDHLLLYLYDQIKIYNWNDIASEINSTTHTSLTAADCRNRYLQIVGPLTKNQWTPEEEKELYRLHNQNGNRWAVIAFNLLGRTDNSVKNHFYSKLRKSLRTLNKVAKLHLKKLAKEVGGQVIYKLTEATDQSLKQNSDLPKEISAMCYDLKNRLLDYDMDQRQLKSNLDYSAEKELLNDLMAFNKIYKKKPKKASTEPSKKNKTGKNGVKTEEIENSFDSSESQKQPEEEIKKQSEVWREDSEKSLQPKKTVNFVIKEPSKEEQEQYEKQSIMAPRSKVQAILRAEGLLENGEYGGGLFKRDSSSIRSFSSRRSESSNPGEWFGDPQNGFEFIFQGMKDCSENESQFFNSHHE